MTETESSFHLSCFDDDFESLENLKKIHEYYECKIKSSLIRN